MNTFTIELSEGLENLIPSMYFIESVRDLINWNELKEMRIIYKGIGSNDLSASIKGFVLELMGECRKREISFILQTNTSS